MFTLVETAIGFAAIMLMLSLLVKSLTSLIKNHVDYYSTHFEAELRALIRQVAGKTWQQIKQKKGFQDIDLRKIGDDFLTEDNMKTLLGVKGQAQLDLLKMRLDLMKKNIKYTFGKRSKNLSLLAGMGLCMALNINAFTLWDKLYRDGDLRAKLSSEEFLQGLEADYKQSFGEVVAENDGSAPGDPAPGEAAEEESATVETATDGSENEGSAGQTEDQRQAQRAALDKEWRAFQERLGVVEKEIGFGMGAIWQTPSEELTWRVLLYELLGSFLTGVLVSIGAPYWHDALRAFISMRSGKAPSGAG